ncbi:MAG: tetratricopeptide repeat protein [Chlorobi bacterium]|nr:tetratricopeptide repeat protein [Chlorobiota bacterium]
MKKLFFLLILFSSAAFAQESERESIGELMLKSKYPQAAALLEEKESNGEELSYDEKFNLAIAYQRMVNHNKAIKILFTLSREKPNDTSVLFAMGESFRALGNKRAAAGVYREVTEKDSSNIVARIESAKIFIEMNNYKSAKDIYNFLVGRDSSNAYYLRQYGYTLHKLGENKKAERFLRKALEINDRDGKAALWLAKIFYDRKEYEEAFNILKESIKFNSFNLPLNKLAAEVLFKMKKYYSAANQYKNVIIIGDSGSVIYQKLGLSLYSSVATLDGITENEKENKLREAAEAFNISLEKDEFVNPLTLTYLGFCSESLKNYKEAIDYLNQSLDAMTPEYIDRVYKSLGASYELTENYPEAIRAYNKSLEFSSGEIPDITFRLATLYDRYYADKSVALAHYKKFLKLSGKTENEMTKYADERIEKLKEEIHFGK